MPRRNTDREINERHYHAWIESTTGQIFYRLAKAYTSKQAARQWARRNYPGQEVIVRECWRAKCAPPLD